MSRTPIMAGNWKMNLNHLEGVGVVQKLAWTLQDKKWDPSLTEAVVIPPFTDLRSVETLIDADKLAISLGAQDVSEHDNGAYTGDISAEMLAKLNCKYVIVGHSERRDGHNETDELVNAKAKQIIAHQMTPIVCVGEPLEIREAGTHVAHVTTQVANSLAGLTPEQVGALVVAYEPIWAIGTGKVATPADAQEVCGAIRVKIAEIFGQEAADKVRIQYGGSVKAGNVADIMAGADVDGCLVGGASLDPEQFAAIVLFANQ